MKQNQNKPMETTNMNNVPLSQTLSLDFLHRCGNTKLNPTAIESCNKHLNFFSQQLSITLDANIEKY